MIDRDTTWSVYTKSSSKQKYLFSSKESDDRLFSIAQKYDLDKEETTNKLFSTTVGDIILGFYKIEDTVPLLQQELGLDPRTAALLGADVLDFLAPLSDPNWQPPVEEIDEEEDYDGDDTDQQIRVEETSPEEQTPTQIPSASPIEVTNNQPYHVPFTPYDSVPPIPTSTHQTTAPSTTLTTQPDTTSQEQPPTPNPALHTMASDMEDARQGDGPRMGTTPSMNLESSPTYISQNQDSLRQPLSNTPTYAPDPTLATPAPLHNPEPPRWS